MRSTQRHRFAILTCGAVALVVLGVRFAMIDACGNPLPYWDQWDAEARDVVVPWHEGELSALDLFERHNEHRIPFTKALSLALLVANGAWEQRVEMVAGALAHVATAILLVWLAPVLLPGRRRAWMVAAALILFCLPFGWYNTVNGFQSQFYFLELFSVLAFVFALRADRFGASFVAGGVLAVVACLSMGSGLLCPLALGLVCAYLAVVDAQRRRLCAASAVLHLAIAGVFLALSGGSQHLDLASAEGLSDFLAALARTLAWPFVNTPWLAVVVWAPFACFAAWHVAARRPLDPGARWVLTAGVWILLQIVAMAYVRGHGGVAPPSRYLDLLALGLVAAFVGLMRLMPSGSFAGRDARRWAAFGAAAVWVIVVAGGLARFSVVYCRPALVAMTEEIPEQIVRCRSYLATGELETLTVGVRPGSIPYPDGEKLAAYLDAPAVRSVLPVVLRDEDPAAWKQWRRSGGPLGVATEFGLDSAWGLVAAGGVGLVVAGAFGFRRRRRRDRDCRAVEAEQRETVTCAVD